ncbi:MAG: hypothetical protein A3C08_03540 [Candidatus Taylorbacteria bacterium RIFCSPHIGHO2_02_FULL_47_18]|uniref:Uncharacterized protein n=1 Tax=Candidatus Taylorbacteria bacterium RIFCSPLOWO2_01_FULL_48_100 TaxID=1802322 RepID=A0A1G2NCU0_9BACT|nr:MAG: hypothetical protein A2670_00900 [Candidatus Taylorbacteria bacterium RIFCSPHIGHO2_01_FULL_48_38]OHA28206.1 MAG: hypothetical protein A3C08_03540 [Candidatus Taylorbacteria bacterium RIFCSPHIGHO2_02_FULL_47_18]OHA33907.1 MAG: hypothetical protein A2938_02690 [Candidatus Taylorbacteria bacterium RIFCSPLOWO2_01_FULL_48_100]OHA40882.1 MAG: hypothetical protein A3J31_03700 [Candidatus Taylorbacteria bacterium RIFCSPLOWO2_02_FULL_48_16]OHA45106.1 MAG: hypothetical protein A3H13_02885 [Candid
MIDRLLDSLQITKKYTDSLTKLDGALFMLVPFGGEQSQNYEHANRTAIKCVQNRGGPVPIGTSTYAKGVLYTEITAPQRQLVTKLKTDASAITTYVSEELEKSENGQLGIGATVSVVRKVVALKSAGEKDLLPINLEALAKNHSSLKP